MLQYYQRVFTLLFTKIIVFNKYPYRRKFVRIMDSNYKNLLRKMVAKLTDEEKIMAVNVDDVFVGGKIDYNKEIESIESCAYKEQEIPPAVAKWSTVYVGRSLTTNFNVPLYNFSINARDTYDVTFQTLCSINDAKLIRLKVVGIVCDKHYLNIRKKTFSIP